MNSIKIKNFQLNLCEQAAALARANYEEEREQVPILPDIPDFPWVKKIAANGLGFIAIEDDRLIGFLCCTGVIENNFGLVKGTFSPIHAHGAIKENRSRIYSQLYQAAAETWVHHGITSHAIALYAHDQKAVESFFWNGFGLRCVDAITKIVLSSEKKTSGYTFFELPSGDAGSILHLKNALIQHENESPYFMPGSARSVEDLAVHIEQRQSRFFCAGSDLGTIGFIEVSPTGENFITRESCMMNICGAYLKEKERGTGIFSDLLGFVKQTLFSEGYTHLGVDFESFNPPGRGFWLKHFTPYTFSVIRRIDERIHRHPGERVLSLATG